MVDVLGEIADVLQASVMRGVSSEFLPKFQVPNNIQHHQLQQHNNLRTSLDRYSRERMMESSRLQILSIILLSIYQIQGFLPSGTSHHDNGNRIRQTTAQTTIPLRSADQPPQTGDSEDPFSAAGGKDLMTTIKGGLTNIFEFAAEQKAMNKRQQESRREEEQQGTQQSGDSEQPRWHPYPGINSSNPNFRTAAPVMTNTGFAKSIWRNVRKRNKPVLWKNALRTYDRMAILEEKTKLQIKRTNLHHEGAMLACAKLGLWQKCLEIYHFVDEHDSATILPPTASSRLVASNLKSTVNSKIGRRVYVTDNMIQSLIRACSRASHQRAKGNKGKANQQTSNGGGQQLEEGEAALRRIPLDTALEIVRTMDENHGVRPGAMHVNPLAAAYQSLGYVEQARDILQHVLSNRTAGEEPETGVDIVNVHDFCAKNKGSYSLLVQGFVASGDWGAAVEALDEMTNAGLYPNPRHCNSWNEMSERHRGRSWKKKRDDFWTNSVI